MINTSIGDRIKLLRKGLDLTQALFAQKIGLKATAIGLYESGDRTVTERSIVTICQTFSVNEEWLRTGKGKMFKQDENTVVSQLSREYGLDDLDRRIIENYLQLDPEKRSVIKNYVRSIFKEQLSMEAADDIDKEVESYRRELEQEKSSKMSPALPNTGENVG